MLSSGNVSRTMTGASTPQRFKLSLRFLNRKKKTKNHLEKDVLATSGSDDGSTHLPEAGIGDILQDIAEGNEEQLQENGRDLAHESADENAAGQYDRCAENDDENLTRALVPKSFTSLELDGESSLVAAAMSYKSFDIAYPPGGSPPSRRRTERSSSMKAFDASTRSGSLRTESTSTQIPVAGSRKGWLSTRCGFQSCAKQIDIESELRSRDRAAHGEKHRSHSSRAKARDPNAWDRDAVSDWTVLADVGNDVGRKKLGAGRRKGYKKSSKLAPSPGISPMEPVLSGTPDIKCLLRDPYEELREAAKYDFPSQRAASEVENSGRSRVLHTLTDGDGNTGEDGDHPWERSFSSSSSEDDELFTTSLEQDGQSKSRRKKWSSNSSDETEFIRHRRSTTGGSHGRSKSTWSSHSLRDDVVREDEIVENQKSGGKKGSRIIFLSTPPRPTEVDIDDDEPASTEQLLLKTSSERFGDFSKLEQADQVQRRFERTYSMGYKSSLPAGCFEAGRESTATAWSKLDVRRNRGDESLSDVSARELPMVSRSKESGQNRSRQIDVQIEDQLVNLQLESDISDSSQGKAYTSLRESRRLFNKASSKPLDQDILPKKKRGTHTRRRRGRKIKAPPPLPTDLHGKVKESVAVVKSSYDPYTDFRDSMVEMIVEKEIQGATDLEELLRCYLSLNSAEYHSVIVKVFADVWRELFADAI